MPADLSKRLVIGISSRALFDLEEPNRVFETEGEASYRKFQEAREKDVLQPGIGFRLVQAILGLNRRVRGSRKAEVVVASRNSPATSFRLFNSIQHHQLDIQQAILTSGTPVARYLKSFCVDLYLSAYEKDVQEALQAGIAAAVIYQANPTTAMKRVIESSSAQIPPTCPPAVPVVPVDPCDEIRVAFDGDNVLFGSEAEDVFQKEGLDKFLEHEVKHASRPLADGPFAKLLRTLAVLQKDPNFDKPPIRTALVTARNGSRSTADVATQVVQQCGVDALLVDPVSHPALAPCGSARTTVIPVPDYGSSPVEAERRRRCEKLPPVDQMAAGEFDSLIGQATRYSRWLRFFDKQIGKGTNLSHFRRGVERILRLWIGAAHFPLSELHAELYTCVDDSQQAQYPPDVAYRRVRDDLVGQLAAALSLRIDLVFKRDDNSICHPRHLQTQSVALLFERGFDFINDDNSLRRCIVRIDGGCSEHLQEYRQLPGYKPSS